MMYYEILMSSEKFFLWSNNELYHFVLATSISLLVWGSWVMTRETWDPKVKANLEMNVQRDVGHFGLLARTSEASQHCSILEHSRRNSYTVFNFKGEGETHQKDGCVGGGDEHRFADSALFFCLALRFISRSFAQCERQDTGSYVIYRARKTDVWDESERFETLKNVCLLQWQCVIMCEEKF